MPANRAPSLVLRSTLVAGALGLAACATSVMTTTARDTLAKTSSCPANQVQVEELGSSRYRATGCGKSETYICKVAEYAVSSCIPESSITPPAAEAK